LMGDDFAPIAVIAGLVVFVGLLAWLYARTRRFATFS
jgi:LPXTG-motif cell wall-anchored protein